jgi:putative transposase
VRDILVLFIHVVVTSVRLLRPGGLRAVVAESVLVRHQLLILNRGRKRAPNLRVYDRIIAGLCTLLIRPARVLRSSIALKPSTLLRLHQMLVKRKYRALFSPKRRGRTGPKGPDKELIDAVVEMKRRNRRWGCRRIAQQIAVAFGIEIDKDVARTGFIGSVLAYGPRAYEGQFVERRSVSP